MGKKAVSTVLDIEQDGRVSHAKQKHAPPPEEQHALTKLGDATRMLAEVRDAPSAKKVMDLAAAAELYARKAKLGQDAIDYAFGVKLNAQRKLGEYIKDAPKAKTGPKPEAELVSDTENKSRLNVYKELEISPKMAAESQRLAELDDDVYERVRKREIKPSIAFRDQKRAGLADRVAALPEGKHRVIYADPPWKYGDERAGLEKADTAAAAQYPTMATSAICELNIKSLAADDAVLFCWATFPLLEDALRVVAAWGFDYKTAFVWDKQRSNIGNYHDARAELLLIATRGSCPIEIDTRPKQVLSYARTVHSRKPDEFRQLIDGMYPTGPRVILFHRGEAPRGWKAWGNEAEVAS